MHANSYQLFKKHALPLITSDMDVLEISPDEPGEPYAIRDLLSKCKYYFACIDNKPLVPLSMVPMLSEYSFDCQDETYDVVLSANVAEHVRKLWRWFKEQARITKPGGLVISVSPMSWPYHACPMDCWRIYPDGYRALFDEVGLEVIHTSCESLVPIEEGWRHEHGDSPVWDTIAIGRKL